MNTNELISEIIYYFIYFEMIEIDNDDDKISIAIEIANRLENAMCLNNLIAIFQVEVRKKSVNKQSEKRLDVLLLELENRKIMLEH